MHARLTPLGVLVLVTGLACVGSTAAASATARCGPAAAKTLAADSAVRVYVIRNGVYGCAVGGPGSFRLGGRTTCVNSSRVAPVVVAGRLAAYGLETCGVDTGVANVVVRRLTDGKRLRSLPAARSPGPESYEQVASLVLKSDGAVAWIGTGSSIVSARKLIDVHEADRTGARLLDSGRGINSSSLRLHGSKLTWKDGGVTRSAMLQ